MLLYQMFAYTTHGKIEQSHRKTTNLKYQLQRGLSNLNYVMNCILYQIFKIILNISSKNIKKRLIILISIKKNNRLLSQTFNI